MECPNQTGKLRLDLWVKRSLSNNTTNSTLTVIFSYSERMRREVKIDPKGPGDAGVSATEAIGERTCFLYSLPRFSRSSCALSRSYLVRLCYWKTFTGSLIHGFLLLALLSLGLFHCRHQTHCFFSSPSMCPSTPKFLFICKNLL